MGSMFLYYQLMNRHQLNELLIDHTLGIQHLCHHESNLLDHTQHYCIITSSVSTLTNTFFADLCPDIFVPIPPKVKTVPAAPPAIVTAVVAILIKDPFKPVVGLDGAPGIVVLPHDAVSVDIPSF